MKSARKTCREHPGYLHRLSVGRNRSTRSGAGFMIVCLVSASLAPALLTTAGCAVGPRFEPPEPPVEKRYTHEPEPVRTVKADGMEQLYQAGAEVEGDWWRLYHCPAIDSVIKDAVAGNPGFQAALERLVQARESLRAGQGAFFPQVSAGADASRQKFSSARFGNVFRSVIFSLFTASVNVSYLLDIFGGQRRTVEGLGAQVDYQEYTALGTYLSLIGNVVAAVISQAAYRAEIQATEQIIASEREQLRITEVQARAGIVPYSAVSSIQSELASDQATLPALRQNLNMNAHLLAALVGRTPEEWAPPIVHLSDIRLPTELPVALPSDLVRRRPDILAAEAQLHMASANIGVATAALFPSFSLTGDYGQNSTHLSTLFTGASNYWDYGGGVATPAYQGGSLWFQRRAAIKAYQVSRSDYREVLVGAFQQVADALRALEYDAEALEARTAALAAAEESLRLITVNYRAGLVDYLQVMTADVQYRQARLAHISTRALRLQDTAALFVALGGGWWNANLKLDRK